MEKGFWIGLALVWA